MANCPHKKFRLAMIAVISISINEFIFIQSPNVMSSSKPNQSYADLCYLVEKSLSHKFQRISFGAIEPFPFIYSNSLTLFHSFGTIYMGTFSTVVHFYDCLYLY